MRSLVLLLFLMSPCAAAERIVHIFVALADNASQGIERVPAKIGNGDDAENNLYWGMRRRRKGGLFAQQGLEAPRHK
jgi:hypothetical protein